MASWIQLSGEHSANAPEARSSHAMAVVDRKAYVFGGELEPRVPIDNIMYVFDLGTRTWARRTGCGGDVPGPRVGLSMAPIGRSVYAFGGRDGARRELADLYSFDVDSGVWKKLVAASSSQSPEARSYHAMAADPGQRKLYVFGGCGEFGRLSDLWCFDVAECEWTQLASAAPIIPRGGPGLVLEGARLWLLFGFSGQQLRDVRRYSLSGCSHEWDEAEVPTTGETPSPRSVFGAALCRNGKGIAVFGGEIAASGSGHLGAGVFSDDVFCLDTDGLVWTRIEPAPVPGHGPRPCARGWFAFAPVDDGSSMLVHGGNSDSNVRLDDMYLLSFA